MKRAVGKVAQLYRRAKKRRDNRGSAIVIVIIAMAMIGILATTMLWMAYMNYMIKVADIRNKNSFYTAEEVVEQVMSGLRRESAEAVGVAYRDVLANWDNLSTEEARSNVFMTTYLDTLIDKLKDPARGTGYYDRTKLETYVDAGVFQRGTPTAGVDEDAWDHGAPLSDPAGDSVMEIVNNNSIILKNIYVSCTDNDDRVSIVQTDICLDVPKLIFENSGSIDALYQYTLIGNEGIEVQVPGIIKTEGSIYAGTDVDGKGGLTLGIRTEADGKKTKLGNTNMILEDSLRVISKGDIMVQGPSSGLTVRDVLGQDNRVYAKNITLNSASASIDSKVYVANDLTLDGVGSRVALTKEYYGYGTSTYNGFSGEPAIDSAASSAIIINGKDSTVDMSAVTRLLIAGRSYIGSNIGNVAGDEASYTNVSGVTVPKTPVMMGESIAVKGGQVAYLVPAECIGTLKGESEIGQNPINADKENDIVDFQNTYGADFKEVDFDRKVYRLNGKSLSEFGVVDMNHVRKVYAPYKGGSLLYYYLVMEKTQAEKYFVQYYDFHANREEIDTYFNRYLSGGFQLGDFTSATNQYTILGNSLVSSALSASGVTLLTSVDQTTLNPPAGTGDTGTPGEGSEGTDPAIPVDPDAYTETGINADEVVNNKNESDVLALSDQIRAEYKGLNYNLKEVAPPALADPDIDPVEAAKHYVFNSIIKEAEVEQYLNDNSWSHVTYKTSDTPSAKQAVLAKGDVTVGSSNVFLTGSGDTLGATDRTHLIVCFGNVTVEHDFTGLIIAKGKITVTGANNINRGGTNLADVLEANSEHWKNDGTGDNRKPIDMFVDGGGSMLNGAQAPGVDDAGNLVLDYSELVRYMNWIKK